MTTARKDVEAGVRANYAAQCEAMVAGDAVGLGELLTEDFTLTHMTGYEQPRSEWLADVASGAMSYHAMQDVAITVDLHADGPVLTARTRTSATIWGAYGTWPLQLEIHYTRAGGRWLAGYTVATTW